MSNIATGPDSLRDSYDVMVREGDTYRLINTLPSWRAAYRLAKMVFCDEPFEEVIVIAHRRLYSLSREVKGCEDVQEK